MLFKFYETKGWFDIGNTNKLKETQSYFNSSIKVLDKLNESKICRNLFKLN